MNKIVKRTVVALAVPVIAVATLAGCGNKASQPFQDAPRPQQVNSSPAEVIQMPDGFNNLATKCDHHNRIYVSFHGDGSYGFGFAVKDDPSCP